MYTDNDPILQAIKTERSRLAAMIDEARVRITALDACADALVGTEALHSEEDATEVSEKPMIRERLNGVEWSVDMVERATKMLGDGNTQRVTADAVGVSLGALQREIYRGILKSANRRVY